jgi:hypothetical protein
MRKAELRSCLGEVTHDALGQGQSIGMCHLRAKKSALARCDPALNHVPASNSQPPKISFLIIYDCSALHRGLPTRTEAVTFSNVLQTCSRQASVPAHGPAVFSRTAVLRSYAWLLMCVDQSRSLPSEDRMPPRLEPGRCAQGEWFQHRRERLLLPRDVGSKRLDEKNRGTRGSDAFPTSSTPAAPHQRGWNS